jgi:hypothetical protein
MALFHVRTAYRLASVQPRSSIDWGLQRHRVHGVAADARNRRQNGVGSRPCGRAADGALDWGATPGTGPGGGPPSQLRRDAPDCEPALGRFPRWPNGTSQVLEYEYLRRQGMREKLVVFIGTQSSSIDNGSRSGRRRCRSEEWSVTHSLGRLRPGYRCSYFACTGL